MTEDVVYCMDLCSNIERRVGGSTVVIMMSRGVRAKGGGRREGKGSEVKASKDQQCSDGSAVPLVLVLVLRCDAVRCYTVKGTRGHERERTSQS